MPENIGKIIAFNLPAQAIADNGTRRGFMFRRKPGRYGLGNESGMSLMEVLVVMLLIGILAGIATIMLMRELPNIRLKEATRNLFYDIQTARMHAVRRGRTCLLRQLPGQGNGYQLVQNGVVLKTVNLADFGGVSFGSLDATAPAPASGTFNNDRLEAQPSGMTNIGQFYLRGGSANQLGRRIDVNAIGRPSILIWDSSTSTYKKQ